MLGRPAWVVITFEIDEHGIPVGFSPLNMTADLWASQSVRFLNEWRFKPALLDGKPVTAKCSVELVWGAKILDVVQLRLCQLDDRGKSQIVAALRQIECNRGLPLNRS